MTLLQVSNLFDAVASITVGLNSYTFGWPSDRVRSRATNDPDEQDGALFPRLLFAVPTMEQDVVNNRDVYNVQLFFDTLLGYENDGGANNKEQIEHWRDLMNIATSWVKTLQTSLPTLRPDGVAIVGPARFTLDSFASQQRLISVVLEFQLATNTSCASYVDFPSSVPPDFTWPPKDVVTGNWVKGEQTYTAQVSATLDWTANTYELTDAWIVNVYQNGQRILESQYDVSFTSIEIDADTHYEGATYYILALWTV